MSEPKDVTGVVGGARGYGVRARGYGVGARGNGAGARGYGSLVIIVTASFWIWDFGLWPQFGFGTLDS